MKITHYLYNAYLVEVGNRKIAIDPGGLFLYYFRREVEKLGSQCVILRNADSVEL